MSLIDQNTLYEIFKDNKNKIKPSLYWAGLHMLSRFCLFFGSELEQMSSWFFFNQPSQILSHYMLIIVSPYCLISLLLKFQWDVFLSFSYFLFMSHCFILCGFFISVFPTAITNLFFNLFIKFLISIRSFHWSGSKLSISPPLS